MCPTSQTQLPAPAQVAKGSPEGGSSSNTTAINPTNDRAPAFMAPAVNPLMVPQLPYLHPIIVVNQFIPFPIGPQLHFPYFPYPFPAWYYFQQSMMNIPYVQPMPSPSVAPHGENPISQSTNTGSGTSITNIVTINEIGNEKGNDNSTNVEIRKNGTHLSCCMNMRLIDVAIGHRNTGSD